MKSLLKVEIVGISENPLSQGGTYIWNEDIFIRQRHNVLFERHYVDDTNMMTHFKDIMSQNFKKIGRILSKHVFFET